MFSLEKVKATIKRKLFGGTQPPKPEVPKEETKSRVAVRFFVKKSKRFSILNKVYHQVVQETGTKIAGKERTQPECLLYLGLAPKTEKLKEKDEKKEEEFKFTVPKIYECDYCTKIFFHPIVHRRHMMKHFKRIHRCCKCHAGFTSRIAKKRHQINCRQ